MVKKNKEYESEDYRQTSQTKESELSNTSQESSSGDNVDYPCFRNCEIAKEDGQTIQIRDVWLAIGMFFKIVGGVVVVCVLCGFFLRLLALSSIIIVIATLTIFVIGFIFAIRVWSSYNQGIIVSSKYDKINFPASDVENRLIDIITLKKFRDLANRIEFNISEIDKVWVDRQRKRVTYTDRSGKKPKEKTKTIVQVSRYAAVC